jgi:D-tyrosyl-tRNA(Tyr) deacylase
MRAVVQRATRATVTVQEEVTGKIDRGLLVLIAVGIADTEADADYLADKIIGLRVFEDDMGKMNLNLSEVGAACWLFPSSRSMAMCGAGSGHRSTPPLLRKKRAPFTNILWSAFALRVCPAKPADFRK